MNKQILDIRDKPLLSIWLITYNHQQYIAKAIDSVQMQHVNFNYEIVIADDCSTDGTTDIIKKYVEKNPAVIKPLFQEKNVGAVRNAYEFGLPACKGKYVAILEGDDYWTDPNKLQKQVDFLESHPKYSMCCHNAQVMTGNKIDGALYSRLDKDQDIDLKDLLKENIIPTASCVFVNQLNEDFYSRILKLKTATDWFLHLYNAERGKIRFMHESMSVYRAHAQGLWSSLNTEQAIAFRINFIFEMNRAFDYKYDEAFKETLIQYALKLKSMVGKKDVKNYLLKKISGKK